MDKLPPRPGNGNPSTQWTAKSFTFRFERKIVAIDQATRTFTIDIPMVMCLDPKYPPARIYDLIHKFPTISDVSFISLALFVLRMDVGHWSKTLIVFTLYTLGWC